MTKFINASLYKVKKERRNSSDCDTIIDLMNKKIKKGEDRITLNTGLDKNVPFLNESDIEWLKKRSSKTRVGVFSSRRQL